MLDNNTKINCPECNEEIIINTKQLLLGVKFSCFNCNLIVGLANESKSLVNDALNQFSKIKS